MLRTLPYDPITAAARHFRGWSYGGYSIAHRRVDCCAFAALVGASALDLHDLAPASDRSPWARANVWDRSAPWSAPEVAHELLAHRGAVLVDAAGVAHLPDGAVDTGPQLPTPGRWHWVQGWRSLTEVDAGVEVGMHDRGHTLLWYALDAHHGWALESQPGSGPCIRAAGHVTRLEDAIDEDGYPAQSTAGRWLDRVRHYPATAGGGVAWCVLPELS